MTLRVRVDVASVDSLGLAKVLVGSLLLALLARVQVPLPFSPVPVTGQTLGVLWLAAWWGPRLGVATVLAYLAEGFVGLPVFAHGGGPAALFGPTGGYLFGFVAMAWVAGTLVERWQARGGLAILLAFGLAELALYALGVPWLALYVGWSRAWAAGFWPFLLGDGLKALAATALFRAVRTYA